MPNFQILKLPPADWRLYKQIRLESLTEAPQAFSSSYAETLQRPDSHWQQRLIDAQAGEKSWLLFAKENDQITGMVGAFRPVDNPGVVDIISVYVTREKRGQGVASALMAAILAEVGRGGAIHIARLAVTTSQSAAVALYQKFGFQIVAETTGVLGDGIIHAGYIMQLDLAGPV